MQISISCLLIDHIIHMFQNANFVRATFSSIHHGRHSFFSGGLVHARG